METLTTKRPLRAPASTPNRVREFRKARGLTQQQLAEALGVQQPAISQLERHYNGAIGNEAWYRMADFFDVDPRILRGIKNF